MIKNVFCSKCGTLAEYNGYDIRHNYGVVKYVCPVCGHVIYDEDDIEVYDERVEH